MERNKFSTREWVLLAIGVVFIVLGIVLIKAIGWLKVFGEWDLGAMVLFLGISILIIGYFNLTPERDAKVYFTPEGEPDTITPRHYEARKLLPLQGFLSRGKIAISKSTLMVFEIDNGIVTIITKSGKTFTSPLNELQVQYHMEKGKLSGYTLKSLTTEEKITFYYPGLTFEVDEWKDMTGVLSAAAEVKASKLAKASKFLEKAKEFDVADIAGSAIDIAIDTVPGIVKHKSPAAKTLTDFAKKDTEFEEKEEEKKGLWSKIKSIFWWILLVIVVLYFAFNIWTQIEEHNAQNAADTEYYENGTGNDETEEVYVEEEGIPNYFDFNNGTNFLNGNMINGSHKYPFTLEFTYDPQTAEIDNVIYKNVGSGTVLHLSADIRMLEGDVPAFYAEGTDQGKEFILYFFGDDGEYTGGAYWGDFYQDIELNK